MKEQNITLKIKELAREIAEYWRMPIYEGCWAHLPDKWNKRDFENLVLVQNKESVRNIKREMRRKESYHHWIPIPDIGDCLEKLRERQGFMPEYYKKKDFNRSLMNIFKNYIEGQFTVEEAHYWLLSALLAVLKEPK